MNGLKCCIGVFLVVTFLSGGDTLAQEATLNASRVLIVVPVRTGNVDQSVYRQFDRIVPELKKISKDRIIKLECRYSETPKRERNIVQAYQMASQIEKYLRVRHRLDLDLWITVDVVAKQKKTPPVLTIAVFADDIKRLDAVVIDPKKN